MHLTIKTPHSALFHQHVFEMVLNIGCAVNYCYYCFSLFLICWGTAAGVAHMHLHLTRRHGYFLSLGQDFSLFPTEGDNTCVLEGTVGHGPPVPLVTFFLIFSSFLTTFLSLFSNFFSFSRCPAKTSCLNMLTERILDSLGFSSADCIWELEVSDFTSHETFSLSFHGQY